MNHKQKEHPRRSRRYWFRLLFIAVLAIFIPVLILPITSGGIAMWALVHPGCNNDSQTPADYALPYKEISFPGQGGAISYRGFFVPGSNKATLIVPPAYNGNRAGMLHEVAPLAKRGFSLLLYESRVCAGQSSISLGYKEVDDVGSVLDYLKRDPDKLGVDLTRLALHGFSSAGATSLMATARYPDIRAVLAEGGYHNADAQMGIENPTSVMDVLILFGARLTYRLAIGLDSALLSPVDAIANIPPRPIFLVYGSREVSLNGAKLQLDAATAKGARLTDSFVPRLWIVPGATHGSYTYTVGVDEYIRRVGPFYDCALLEQCAPWDALWKS